MSEESSAQKEQARSRLEPIEFNSAIVPNKRHPIDNLLILPQREGFTTFNNSDPVSCLDYNRRVFENKREPITEIWVTIENSRTQTFRNGKIERIFNFNHIFKSPQIKRLGNNNVEKGIYFILDKNTPNTVYRLEDDLQKSNRGKAPEPAFEEEELNESRIEIREMTGIDEIRRIGEYLMIIGTDQNEQTKVVFVDQGGEIKLSQQINYQIDKIVTNLKDDEENRFIFVTKKGKIKIVELTTDSGRLTLTDLNNLQTANIDHVTKSRNFIDVSIFGDEVAVVVDGTQEKESGKKLVNIISGDGEYQIIDKEEKEDIVGITYLQGLPYKLYNENKCINAVLITR